VFTQPRTSGTQEAAADPFTATQTSWVSTAFSYGSYGNVTQAAVDKYAGIGTTPASTVLEGGFNAFGQPRTTGTITTSLLAPRAGSSITIC
jgi:hypothetical protein